jgi:hypothetical protein
MNHIFRYKQRYIIRTAIVSVVFIFLIFYGAAYYYSFLRSFTILDLVIIVILPFLCLFSILPSFIIWTKTYLLIDNDGIKYITGGKKRTILWDEISSIAYKHFSLLHLDSHLRLCSKDGKKMYISNQIEGFEEALGILSDWLAEHKGQLKALKIPNRLMP